MRKFRYSLNRKQGGKSYTKTELTSRVTEARREGADLEMTRLSSISVVVVLSDHALLERLEVRDSEGQFRPEARLEEAVEATSAMFSIISTRAWPQHRRKTALRGR